MAASYLYDSYGEGFQAACHGCLPGVEEEKIVMITEVMQTEINCPPTSSAGRLFDAVASLCGLCDAVTFEAEAAMRLEACCKDPLSEKPYEWTVGNENIDLRETVRQICNDRQHGVDTAKIAARFHATIIDVIVTTCLTIRNASGIDRVALSGGCFQNRCIFEGTLLRLQENDFPVLTHSVVPCNDGGVALGQLVVAANAAAVA